jgi:hypothetical protein
VRVPFPAPPAERDRRRLWIALGVGGALFAVCCVGGIFGFGTLVVQTSRELLNQATAVVDTYLGALRSRDYPAAYNQLCTNLRHEISLDQFQTTQAQLPQVLDYSLEPPRGQGSAILVRAEVTRSNAMETDNFRLVQDGQATTSLKICQITQ